MVRSGSLFDFVVAQKVRILVMDVMQLVDELLVTFSFSGYAYRNVTAAAPDKGDAGQSRRIL